MGNRELWLMVAIAGLLALTSTLARAGGWNSSGGGDVIGDVRNPWFLALNTPPIKVCFKHDDAREPLF